MSDGLKIFIGGIVAGIVVFIIGVRSQQGHSRGMYLMKGFPGHPSGYIYGYIPIGLSSFLIAFLVFLPEADLRASVMIYVGLPLAISGIILMAWQPRWLKPWWLKWLEDNYGDIIEQMLEEARHTEDFAEITPDEDSLATWASGVAYKYRRYE